MDVLKTAKASHEVSVVFLLPAKKVFSLFFPQRRTFRLKNTVSYNTRLLVLFFEMNLFFVASKENLNTDAVLFSLQCFPIPRVVVKKSFSTRKTI